MQSSCYNDFMEFIVKRNWDTYNELARVAQQSIDHQLTPGERIVRCGELHAMSRFANDDSEECREYRVQRKLEKIERRRQMIPALLRLAELMGE